MLVRAQAVTVSRPDLLWREGSYFEEPEFPAPIGYDAAGVVESIGPEVKTLKVGNRVSTFPAASLLDYAAHAETITYPETALLVYPENLTRVQAAAVNTGLFTAYFALLELAYFKRDQHVVITAGGEDVQEAILDLTEGLGAEVIYDAVAGPGLEELVWAKIDRVFVGLDEYAAAHRYMETND